jgi:hydrogenase expression/formation protein HypC
VEAVSRKERLESYGSCTLGQDGCTTCGDVAVPVHVVALDNNEALVEDRTGQQATVAIDFLTDVNLDDVLLVHLGVAIAKVGHYEIR